ncbi:hypothetical protein KC19_10G151200 [Ceratodon purpureus]|uniref:Protein kinase domain-containing protein n=1 Tax=Ceratodon purpureus TaxID=3225 RepID=A0A8T0GQT7_CERPU|nr:hypothetical protein KC19_10G151200 [Ceratodon purpureus]
MAFFRTFSAFKNVFKPKSFKFDEESKGYPEAFTGPEVPEVPVEKLFSPTSSQYANTPEQFLELIKACKEQALKMLAPSLDFRVNYEQCNYLAEKLKSAAKRAHSFLPLVHSGFLSVEEIADCLNVFKLFYALSNIVEKYIQNCCQADAWIQSAFLMTNVTEHTLSVSVDLELLTEFFSGSLTLAKLDSVYRDEAAVVRNKASQDRAKLFRDLNTLLQTREKTSAKYRLADLLLKRLESQQQNLPDSDISGAYRTDMMSLKEKEQLGRGSFATVFKATWLGVEVAKKTFYTPSCPEFEKEVSILGQLSHPNITPLLCCAESKSECCMVMELMDGDLFQVMRKIMAEEETLICPFSILEAVDIMLQIGGGMAYLHEMGIVHRDLKAMNILVRHVKGRGANGRYFLAKVADFGLSKIKERSMTYSMQTCNLGSARWMAPELIKVGSTEVQEEVSNSTQVVKYPLRGDMHSFAMVCYEILTGKLPYFETMSLNEVKKKVLLGDRPKLPRYCPPDLKHLIERCWSQDPSKRPRFQEICAALRRLKLLILMPHGSAKYVNMKPRGLNFKWVVVLDFGTTYSGFAYARASAPKEICVYYDWPSRTGEKPHCKTSTALYYKPTGSGEFECASWGHIARSDFMASRGGKADEPQGLYLSNFKLLLKEDLNDPALAASIPPPLTIQTIIADYLLRIGELALSVIQSHEGDANLSRDSVQWCVTVPSIWDEYAKMQMKACMVNAGLVSAEAGRIEAVKVVLEPEAASFHCHQILRQEHKDVSLNVEDKILVADVGGGTVDVVVQELVGDGRSYQVKELTESSGGLCGGAFIDESFMRFLLKKIGCLNEFLRKDYPSYKTRLLKDWEHHKCAFGHELISNTDTKEITLHAKLSRKWEEYETAQGLPPRADGYSEIELTEEDMKSIFDPVVDEILELIAAQLMQVPNIKVMFVVGGFAGSPYFIQRIRARFLRDVQHIVCPQNPGSAVLQGAVSLACNPEAIFSRIAKKTYGTSVTHRFDHAYDPQKFLKIDSGGVEWCRNRFDIFVTKGSRVEVNKRVTKEYIPHSPGQTHMLFDLHSSTEQDPRYTEGPNVRKEGGFSVTLPQYCSRDDMPVFNFTMYFGRSSIELSAEARYKRGQKPETLALPVEYYQ